MDAAASARAVELARVLVWAAVAGGIVLRLARYAANRSLWGDEGALALNVLDKSYRQLLEPLSFMQGAPTGFLFAEKAAVGVFGSDELTLRLVPLLGGVVSLVLFAALCRRLLRPWPAVLAVVLAATVEPLVYFPTEVKQYSTDVAVAMLLLYAALAVDWSAVGLWSGLALALGGAAAAWFSHPGLIVLGSLTIALLAIAWRARDRAAVAHLLLLGSVWATSAIAAFLVNGRNAHRVGTAAVATTGSRAAGPLGPVKDVWNAFDDAAGFARTTTALAVALAAAGLVSLARRRPAYALLVSAPIVATFLAAVVHRYPFSDRFVLFLAPLLILLVAEGADVLVGATWSRAPVVAVVALGLLLAYPLGTSAKRLLSPPGHEEVKSVVRYMGQRWKPGDTLFVWYQSQYPFRYYVQCRSCDVLPAQGLAQAVWPRRPADEPTDAALVAHPPRLYVGQTTHELDAYLQELAPLRGKKRVWLLFSSTWDDDFVRLALDCLGTRLDSVQAMRAVGYLYDLSKPPARPPAGCAALVLR